MKVLHEQFSISIYNKPISNMKNSIRTSIDDCLSITNTSSNQLRISDNESVQNQYGSPISYNFNSLSKFFHKKSN